MSVLLILTVGAIALFGFLGMSYIEHGVSHTCPFAVLSDNNCLPVNNILALTIHHISGLQYLMQSIVTPDSTLLILSLLLLAMFLIISVKIIPRVLPEQHLLRLNRYISEKLDFNPNRQLLYWLALRNKRDSHVPHWVHDTA